MLRNELIAYFLDTHLIVRFHKADGLVDFYLRRHDEVVSFPTAWRFSLAATEELIVGLTEFVRQAKEEIAQ